jgi:hypothetical protein
LPVAIDNAGLCGVAFRGRRLILDLVRGFARCSLFVCFLFFFCHFHSKKLPRFSPS